MRYALADLSDQQSAAAGACDTPRVTDDRAPTEAAYVRQINTCAERILSADDPHDVALELMGALIDFVAGYNVASRMYRIWGELTDWVDFQEPNEPIARAEMVRAAREWLALASGAVLEGENRRIMTCMFYDGQIDNDRRSFRVR